MQVFHALSVDDDGLTYMPYAGKTEDGQWLPGYISVAYLEERFGKYNTAAEMKAATESEGLRLYFDLLVEQGVIPE